METSLLFQHWGVWNQLLGSPPAEISPGLSPVHAEESSDMSPLQRTIFRHGSSPKTALICTKEEPLAVPPAPPPSPLVPAGAGTGVRLLPSCSPAKPGLCGAVVGFFWLWWALSPPSLGHFPRSNAGTLRQTPAITESVGVLPLSSWCWYCPRYCRRFLLLAAIT